MPPLLPPVDSQRFGYRGLSAATRRWWSVAACQMSSFDQSAGAGRDGVKNRCSTEIWLPSTSRVGSARPLRALVQEREALLEGAEQGALVVDRLPVGQHEVALVGRRRRQLALDLQS